MSKLKLFLILASSLLISCANPNDPGNDTTEGGNGGGGTTPDGKPSWYLSDAQQSSVYQPNPVIVFDSKQGDIYRIAGIVETTKGTLVAVSDSRKTSESDVGFSGAANIDVVVKRSTDGGKTWGQAVKIPPIAQKKEDSHGDPLIFSCKDGTLVVLCAAGNAWAQQYGTQNDSKIKMSKSIDDGQSWSQWTEIQKVIYDNTTVQGKGFIKGFAASGRGYTDPDTGALYAAVLVGNYGHSKKGTVVIKSVDNGTTWTVIGVLEDNGNDEPKVVTRIAEGTHTGKLLLSVRPSTADKRKFFLLDENQGEASSISTYAEAGTFNDPTIDAEGMRYTLVKDGHTKNRILHVYLDNNSTRKNLSLVMSEDEGKTWINNKVIQPDLAAYSSIIVLGDGTIGILAEEKNLDTASGSGTYDIVFRRFNLKAFNGETYTQTW
ncbi:sialidase family protein [Brachyspira pilosicoli]|uniref:sialidase family protein n=1 Tax=Brachyspira pilosicoli TaxID=52584 RepID=UPI0012F47DEC|nr:sialidase family protein [Brachyspira pilosicoli]